MKTTKVDLLMLGVAALCVLLAMGMMTGWWQLVLYPIPLLVIVLLLIGSLNHRDEIGKAAVPVLVFSVPMTALFIWIGATVTSDARLLGFQASLGVVYYFLWPFLALFSGLLYTVVYRKWLKPSLDESAG